MNLSARPRGWFILFAAWTLQGCAAALILTGLPADPENAVILGLSMARLALISASVIFTIIAVWLARQIARQPNWLEIDRQSKFWDAALVAGLVISLVSQAALAVLHGLSQAGLIYVYVAYASRLAPLLNLLSLSALELAVWITWQRRNAFKPARPLLISALWIWLGLSLVMALAAITGVGVRFEPIGVWSKPTIPFWEWQIALVWAIGTFLLLLELSDRLPHVPHPDLWIGFAIWAGVCALWLSQPINLGWQAGPRAPNFEPYPFSDALTYGQYAQSILIGNGLFEDAIPARPLYIVFLAGLHALAGQDYGRVIALQSLVLALFPVVLYFIGKEISGRPLGIMLAVLAATRDVMTNLSADYAGNFSFSKFYLSELPAALLLSLFTLCLLKSTKRPTSWNMYFMLAGGALGLATLIRTQSLFLLPPALLLSFLSNREHWRNWLKATFILIFTVALTIVPWLWRNWQITGGLVMDDPFSQMAVRARSYQGIEEFVDRLPNESDKEYSARLISIALTGVRENPGLTARLIVSHFLNSEIGNVLLFPVRNGLQNLTELLRPTRAFWEQVELDFKPAQSALLAAYLLLFSLGMAAAWHARRWAGLMPLVVNLAYNLSTAVFISSGMRFLLPVDWGFYLYYALGLMTVTRGVMLAMDSYRNRLLTALPPSYASTRPLPFTWKPVLLGSLAFFVLGSSIPLSERIVPARYQPASQESLIRLISRATPAAVQPDLARTLEGTDIVLFQGRALYPRYYGAGEGEPNTTKLGYGEMPQARLVFVLVGAENSLVIFDLSGAPAFFPNASDVVLIARRGASHFQALAVLVENNGRAQIYFAPLEKD